eukprot:3092568-Rhodomonas_salina.2
MQYAVCGTALGDAMCEKRYCARVWCSAVCGTEIGYAAAAGAADAGAAEAGAEHRSIGEQQKQVPYAGAYAPAYSIAQYRTPCVLCYAVCGTELAYGPSV